MLTLHMHFAQLDISVMCFWSCCLCLRCAAADRVKVPCEEGVRPDRECVLVYQSFRLRPLQVRYTGGHQTKLVSYQQAFDSSGARLCLHCRRVVPGAMSQKDAVLSNGYDLFCCVDCESMFALKNSSGATCVGLAASPKSLLLMTWRLLCWEGWLRNPRCFLVLFTWLLPKLSFDLCPSSLCKAQEPLGLPWA